MSGYTSEQRSDNVDRQPALDRPHPSDDHSIQSFRKWLTNSKPQAIPGPREPVDVPTIERGTYGEVFHKNERGQIIRMDHPDGNHYQYAYDQGGILVRAKVTSKEGYSVEWRKQGEGEWRLYISGNPEQLRLHEGNWEVAEDGRPRHFGGLVSYS
jgi:YD repeat-containing protein